MDVEHAVPGSAALQLADGVRLQRPDEQVFTAMLDGWRNQQLARNLSFGTVESRRRSVRAFAEHAQALPWRWTPQLVDEWCTDLRAVRRVRRSTLRGYQETVRLFCAYLTDPSYGWVGECEKRFGTHPVQVVHEWNAAVHVAAAEGDPAKRAFTLDEMQALLDYADEQVIRIRAAGRKGWLPAFRDATLFKVAYGYGLRRYEARMLDVADFGRNPHASQFGEYGVLYVRHGKAMKGSAPKRRSVLTVWAWVPEVLAEWVEEIRPLLAAEGNPALWPSEWAPRGGLAQLNARLSAYRDPQPGRRPGLPLAAPLLRHPSDRRWLGSVVRTAAAWPRTRFDYGDLYRRVVEFSHPHAAAGSRRDHERGTTTGTGDLMSMKRQFSYRWRLRR